MAEQKQHSGFVSIIGSPNVGKSTLLNAFMGEKLCIVSPKAQTTRHRIMAILNEPGTQIVFSDTPGLLEPAYKLQERMLGFAEGALRDADVAILVTDPFDNSIWETMAIEVFSKLEIPRFIVLNKLDLLDQDKVQELAEKWKAKFPEVPAYVISAQENFNVEVLLEDIKKALPEHPPYYGEDELTDRPMRFFISEIIREKILTNYKKEIPYSCQVRVESYKEEEDIVRIRAVISVMRTSQRAILLGHQGSRIKKMATEARKDIEKFVDNKVFLDTYVEVDKDWRDSDQKLDQYGYNQ